jgi:hypothetical protein
LLTLGKGDKRLPELHARRGTPGHCNPPDEAQQAARGHLRSFLTSKIVTASNESFCPSREGAQHR